MRNIATGERMIDYLTDEHRLAQSNPRVAAALEATKEVRNVAEEILYQGSIHKLHPDAAKMGRAIASLPMEVYLALANLHPEWFMTSDKREFFKWLDKHPGYRLERKVRR